MQLPCLQFHTQYRFVQVPIKIVTIQARVIANFKKTVAVQVDGESTIEQAYPLRSVPLMVAGDKVECFRDDGLLRVQTLLPRQTVLERADRHWVKPLAANLTHLGIVSANPPGMDTLLIDQFCLAAHQADVDALIIFNKADRLNSDELLLTQELIKTYRKVGYKAVLIDTKTEDGIQPLLDELDGCTFTLVGASGVGKSSIIQRLLPDKDLVVGAVSEATGLGSHTTSVTFWYDLPVSGAIIDSPGVRQFSVSHFAKQTVRQGYHELARAAESCRFGDCSHTVEPACGVQQLLDEGEIARWRYENYKKLAEI